MVQQVLPDTVREGLGPASMFATSAGRAHLELVEHRTGDPYLEIPQLEMLDAPFDERAVVAVEGLEKPDQYAGIKQQNAHSCPISRG
jgi:hypothetical protein